MSWNPIPNDPIDWVVGGVFVAAPYGFALVTKSPGVAAAAVLIPDAAVFGLGVGLSNFVQRDHHTFITSRNPKRRCPYDYDFLIG